MNKYMKMCIDIATKGVDNNEGGPFGACIIDKDGNVISLCNNTVLKDNDPTAHAEINAIRYACKKINSYNLKDYILYTNCEPCPMCLSAIIWSNIKTVYFGCNRMDANNIGFRDKKIYDYFNNDNHILEIKNINRDECLESFNKYNKKIY